MEVIGVILFLVLFVIFKNMGKAQKDRASRPIGAPRKKRKRISFLGKPLRWGDKPWTKSPSQPPPPPPPQPVDAPDDEPDRGAYERAERVFGRPHETDEPIVLRDRDPEPETPRELDAVEIEPVSERTTLDAEPSWEPDASDPEPAPAPDIELEPEPEGEPEPPAEEPSWHPDESSGLAASDVCETLFAEERRADAEARFAREYEGVVVEWTGELERIESYRSDFEFEGDPGVKVTLGIHTLAGGFAGRVVDAVVQLPPDTEDTLRPLRGKPITFRGALKRCDVVMRTIYVRDARLVEAAVDS